MNDCKGLYTLGIFAHNIALKDIFGTWISISQGKLFKKIKIFLNEMAMRSRSRVRKNEIVLSRARSRLPNEEKFRKTKVRLGLG